MELAQRHQKVPEIGPDQSLTLDHVIALRARVLLARHAATQGKWRKADKLLSGFLPHMPAYKMLTGMRVRLIARQVADGLKTGKTGCKFAENGKGRASDLHYLAQGQMSAGLRSGRCAARAPCGC